MAALPQEMKQGNVNTQTQPITSPLDLSSLSKLPNATHAIIGVEKGSTIRLPPISAESGPFKIPFEVSETLKEPDPYRRRLSLPANVGFNRLKVPTSRAEMNELIAKIAESLTGDNIVNFIHLMGLINAEDKEIFILHEKLAALSGSHQELMNINARLQNDLYYFDPTISVYVQRKYINDTVGHNIYLQFELDRCQQQNAQLNYRVDELQREISDKDEQIKRDAKKFNEDKGKIGRKNQSRIDKQANQHKALKEDLEQKISDLNAEKQQLSSEVTDLQNENSAIKDSILIQDSAIAEIEDQNEKVIASRQRTDEINAARNKRLDLLTILIKHQENTITSTVKSYTSQTLKLREEFNLATATIASLTTALQGAKAEAEKKPRESEEYKKLRSGYNSLLTDYNEIVPKCRDLEKELEREKKRFEGKKGELEREVRDLRNQVAQLKGEKKKKEKMKQRDDKEDK